ncbi:hypothetical protein M422DRAFT_81295, partial [Sphaerobolus stellatus SS14]
CLDCDSSNLHCSSCIVEIHRQCPLHRIKTWNGSYFADGSLANLGLLFQLQWIPATLIRPGTAYTFRIMKHFQMLSHVARTTSWDFCTVLQRITDNV